MHLHTYRPFLIRQVAIIHVATESAAHLIQNTFGHSACFATNSAADTRLLCRPSVRLYRRRFFSHAITSAPLALVAAEGSGSAYDSHNFDRSVHAAERQPMHTERETNPEQIWSQSLPQSVAARAIVALAESSACQIRTLATQTALLLSVRTVRTLHRSSTRRDILLRTPQRYPTERHSVHMP